MFSEKTFTSILQEFLEKVFRKPDPNIPSWVVLLKRKYWEYRDYQLGREHMGIDRFGNEYYQYYSYFGGLPTKRIVIYKFFENHHFNVDPHFIPWLHHRADRPPTPSELQMLYLEDTQRKRKAIAWDETQRELLRNAKEKANLFAQKEKQKVLSQNENSDLLLEETRSYKFKEVDHKKINDTVNEFKGEPEIDLKVLRKIIAKEEQKIMRYKEDKENTRKYIENAVDKMQRYDQFREKFKDVFLELEIGESKEKYALVEKDPDIMYSLKNL